MFDENALSGGSVIVGRTNKRRAMKFYGWHAKKMSWNVIGGRLAPLGRLNTLC